MKLKFMLYFSLVMMMPYFSLASSCPSGDCLNPRAREILAFSQSTSCRQMDSAREIIHGLDPKDSINADELVQSGKMNLEGFKKAYAESCSYYDSISAAENLDRANLFVSLLKKSKSQPKCSSFNAFSMETQTGLSNADAASAAETIDLEKLDADKFLTAWEDSCHVRAALDAAGAIPLPQRMRSRANSAAKAAVKELLAPSRPNGVK